MGIFPIDQIYVGQISETPSIVSFTLFKSYYLSEYFSGAVVSRVTKMVINYPALPGSISKIKIPKENYMWKKINTT